MVGAASDAVAVVEMKVRRVRDLGFFMMIGFEKLYSCRVTVDKKDKQASFHTCVPHELKEVRESAHAPCRKRLFAEKKRSPDFAKSLVCPR